MFRHELVEQLKAGTTPIITHRSNISATGTNSGSSCTNTTTHTCNFDHIVRRPIWNCNYTSVMYLCMDLDVWKRALEVLTRISSCANPNGRPNAQVSSSKGRLGHVQVKGRRSPRGTWRTGRSDGTGQTLLFMIMCHQCVYWCCYCLAYRFNLFVWEIVILLHLKHKNTYLCYKQCRQ